MPMRPKLSKWVPTTDLMMLRRMGKLVEELSELSNVAARCIIQGINEVDPGTGKVNRQRLQDEIADVYAQLDETVSRLGLPVDTIVRRTGEKRRQMQEWEDMFKDEERLSPSGSPAALTERALIDAANTRADLYEGDDRPCIKTDVMNAFYAGAEFAMRASPAALTMDADEVEFLAARLRRLFNHFKYPLPDWAKDDKHLIGIAPTCIGAVLANLSKAEEAELAQGVLDDLARKGLAASPANANDKGK